MNAFLEKHEVMCDECFLSSFLEIHENKFENVTQVLEVLQTAFNWQQLLIILKL
jgi:hypothetical protein